MVQAVFNWSGGKDSAFCLHKCLSNAEIDVKYLLTTLNGSNNRISMHGVRRELLKMQARSIGKELLEINLPEITPMNVYDEQMSVNLNKLKKEGIEYSVYGDIFLEDLRQYRESRLAELKMKGLFPIWGIPTREVVTEFISLGFKAVIVCVNDKYLDKSFVGRHIDNSFLNDLPSNVDPCGENGEYHSFVYDGPIFSTPVEFERGEAVYKKYNAPGDKDSTVNDPHYADAGFWYIDLKTKT